MKQTDRLISFLRVTGLVLVPLLLVLALMQCAKYKRESERLSRNQDILLHNGEVEIGRTPDGRATASSNTLLLSASELGRLDDSLLAVTQRNLGIKDKRVMAVARTASSMDVQVSAPIEKIQEKGFGTTIQDSTCIDSNPGGVLPPIQHVSWSDPWVRLEGFIRGDTLHAKVESRDTLQMIVHRVPRKFLFFRFGTKAVRMEVVSQNPHTSLSYPRLIVVKK